MVWKDKKEFSKEVIQIYDAPTKQVAKGALEDFASKWNHKYPYAVKSESKLKINYHSLLTMLFLKSVYLALRGDTKKWLMPIRNWG